MLTKYLAHNLGISHKMYSGATKGVVWVLEHHATLNSVSV